MPENLLAIDNGTQSVRALVFDPRGNLLLKSRIPIEPYYSTAPGLAEQDPEVFWKAVCEACQNLWAQGVDKSSHRRGQPDHPAQHAHQRGQRMASRCARPSTGSTSAAPRASSRWAGCGGGLQSCRRLRDGGLPPGGGRGQLAPEAPARNLESHPQVSCSSPAT